MSEHTHAVTWEAPEHHHTENGGDWFWVLGILAVGGSVAAFFLGNFLFAILILVGAGAMALQAVKKPRVIPFMVGSRGIRIGEKLFPYSTLESYRIDEDNQNGPQLLFKSKSMYSPLFIMPIPEDSISEIENLVKERLPEEDLEEPLAHKLLEILGF